MANPEAQHGFRPHETEYWPNVSTQLPDDYPNCCAGCPSMLWCAAGTTAAYVELCDECSDPMILWSDRDETKPLDVNEWGQALRCPQCPQFPYFYRIMRRCGACSAAAMIENRNTEIKFTR